MNPVRLFLAFATLVASPVLSSAAGQPGEMAGYLLVPNDKVPETFNAGFSMYVAAWPLLQEYPGSRFQTGLFGTWMFAQHEGKGPTNLYSDIEGGLGWWRDTRRVRSCFSSELVGILSEQRAAVARRTTRL